MEKCKLKSCNKRATTKPYEKGLFCSSRCALANVRTRSHQIKAGKKAAQVIIAKYRGTGTGYIKEVSQHQHRVVMERFLKRKLRKGEIVHHIDGNKQNNALNNLEYISKSNNAKHARALGLIGPIKGKLSDESLSDCVYH